MKLLPLVTEPFVAPTDRDMLPSERREFVRTHRTCVFGYARQTEGPAMSVVYYIPTDSDELLVSTMRGRADRKFKRPLLRLRRFSVSHSGDVGSGLAPVGGISSSPCVLPPVRKSRTAVDPEWVSGSINEKPGRSRLRAPIRSRSCFYLT